MVYYLWPINKQFAIRIHFSILPSLINSGFQISTKSALQAACFPGQGIRLRFTYLFEFQAGNTLTFVWLASLLFAAMNFWILISLIKQYHPLLLFQNKDKLKKQS